MPYIPKMKRDELEPHLTEIIRKISVKGELNYAITQLALGYLRSHGDSYSTRDDVIGTIESAKLEFYRRNVVPYEEWMRQKNGDVY